KSLRPRCSCHGDRFRAISPGASAHLQTRARRFDSPSACVQAASRNARLVTTRDSADGNHRSHTTADRGGRPMKARILIVEDDAALTRILADNLVSEGFEVRCVADGNLTVTKVNDFAPDLVLLDV